MRISELSLVDYKGFSGVNTFHFKPQVTIIAGVNGKGKTSLLDAITLLASRILPQISPAKGGYKNIASTDVHYGAETCFLSMRLNCAGIPVQFNAEYRRHNRVINTKLPNAVKREIKFAYGNPTRADDQAPLVVYYTTDRAGYRFPKSLPKAVPRFIDDITEPTYVEDEYIQRRHIANGYQSMAYNGALSNRTVDYKDLMSRLRTAPVIDQRQTENPAYLGFHVATAINRTVEQYLDGFSNLRVSESPPQLIIDKNGETLDIRQLSDGERSIIAIITDLGRRLALANPELENPLAGAGVVLIDEIELHLHPKWQLDIVENLRTTFPNIQFILTTHSPFILQSAREGETIIIGHHLEVDPSGKSLEEVAKYVMDVEDTEYSPRIKRMRETARRYLELANEATNAAPARKKEILRELDVLLAPFSDDPAYTVVLENEKPID